MNFACFCLTNKSRDDSYLNHNIYLLKNLDIEIFQLKTYPRINQMNQGKIIKNDETELALSIFEKKYSPNWKWVLSCNEHPETIDPGLSAPSHPSLSWKGPYQARSEMGREPRSDSQRLHRFCASTCWLFPECMMVRPYTGHLTYEVKGHLSEES